jgi:hypothetical protein
MRKAEGTASGNFIAKGLTHGAPAARSDAVSGPKSQMARRGPGFKLPVTSINRASWGTDRMKCKASSSTLGCDHLTLDEHKLCHGFAKDTSSFMASCKLSKANATLLDFTAPASATTSAIVA